MSEERQNVNKKGVVMKPVFVFVWRAKAKTTAIFLAFLIEAVCKCASNSVVELLL